MRNKTLHLALISMFLIAVSNILVQYPFTIFSYHTTWGAFTYPLIFILTDLTTRFLGKKQARKVIFTSMLPALFISYFLSILFADGKFQGIANLYSIQPLPLRIAIASLSAYVIGQLLDINVFDKYRQYKKWWLAPSLAGICGNLVDTFLFFGIAFYKSSDQILANYWPEIAFIDFIIKCFLSLVIFVPIYGYIMKFLVRKFKINTNDSLQII